MNHADERKEITGQTEKILIDQYERFYRLAYTGILQLNKPIMRYRPDKACFFNVKFFVLYYSILWYFL